MSQVIFVFGSNLAGKHGAGSALHAARYWGARSGVGKGRAGDSYAIPTKGGSLQVLPLDRIKEHVEVFLDYARNRGDLIFQVVAIGCGLAGYTPKQIAPLFNGAPSNCFLPQNFQHYMERPIIYNYSFWVPK